jgi:ketosteroid isomerase-like protein
MAHRARAGRSQARQGLQAPQVCEAWLISSANLDLVRSLYAAWERGDYGSAEWADPDIEFVTIGGPEQSKGTGVKALAQSWRDFRSAGGDYRAEADEYRELDDGRVLVLLHAAARGKTSGLEVSRGGTTGANVFHVRNGKVTRFIVYWDRERALADLGLASDTGTSDS